MATLQQIHGATFNPAAVTGFAPPVSGSLLGWWYLGGSQAASQRNFAGTGDGTIAGSPTYHPGYVSFAGFASGQWLGTQVLETPDLTVLLAVRSAYDFKAGGEPGQPCFLANGGPDSSDTVVPGNRGITLYTEPAPAAKPSATLNALSCDVSAGAVAVNDDALVVNDLSRFSFIALSINSATKARTLYDMTEGTSLAESSTNPRLVNQSIPFRVGANMAAYFTGPCDVAFAAFYGRALVASEVAKTYASVQAYLASLAIVI